MSWLVLLALAFNGNLQSTVLEEHATPAAKNSGEPRLTVGADGELYLSWIERVPEKGHRLRFSRHEADGWTAALTIAQGDDWFVNWADFPSIAALRDGTLAAHWLQKNGSGTYAYDVRISLSQDKGRTWSPSFPPHRDGTPSEHGFASVVVHENQRFGVFWLDGRSMVDADGQPIPGANMSLRYTSFDRSGSIGKELLVDDRVCECCQTGAVALSGDRSLVVYRDRSKSDVRDIRRAVTESGESHQLGAVHADDWKIEGCPVNGPVVRRRGPAVVVAWYTEGKEEIPSILLAWSADEGRTFGKPVRVDFGNAIGRVDLAMESATSCVVTWIAVREGKASIQARRVHSTSGPGSIWTLSGTRDARASGFPRVVFWRKKLVLAWTDVAQQQVRVATCALPTKP